MGNGHEREGEVKDDGNFWLGYLMVILPINKGHIGGGAGMYVPAVGAKMSSNVKGYRYFHSKPFSPQANLPQAFSLHNELAAEDKRTENKRGPL